MAKTARLHLSDKKYPAKMFDFVYEKYLNKIPWEDFYQDIKYRTKINTFGQKEIKLVMAVFMG